LDSGKFGSEIKISYEAGVENIITDNQNVMVSNVVDAGHVAAQAIYMDLKGDANSPITPLQEIHKDAQGFTYHTVRFCDLDRIRDK
jgi:hypothetical protein